jgi:serine phosphatase RsbU (regulator of sigma subunit)/tetratricopeptide (TPR) repeat protein
MKIRFSIFFLAFTSIFSTFAQSSEEDSLLLRLEQHADDDSIRLQRLEDLVSHYRKVNPSKAIIYAEKAQLLAEKLKNWERLSHNYRQIGGIYRLQSNYDKALAAYISSLKIAEKYNLTLELATTLNNIGLIYRSQNNYDDAIKYHQKSLEIATDMQDNRLVAHNLNNLGLVYKAQSEFEKSISITHEALAIYKRVNHLESIVNALNNIGKTFEKANKPDSALYYYEQTLALAKQNVNVNLISEILTNIASLYRQQPEKHEIALQNLNQALSYATQMNNKNREAEIYTILASIYEQKGDSKKAYQLFKKSVSIRDSLFNKEKVNQIAQIQAIYETEKKDQELALKNSEIKKQTLIHNGFLVAFLLFMVLAVWLLRNNRQKQKLNKLLGKQQQEILLQNKELHLKQKEIKTKNEELLASEEELRQNMEELETNQEVIKNQRDALEKTLGELEGKNLRITDSIRYAKRIQNAILPNESELEANFQEYFVIFKPKDVVSGDFYWFEKVQHKKFIAVVDCTGHGVPGAFMSMIGNTLLNEIINNNHIFAPNQILEHLHLGIMGALNQQQNEYMQDGMDIALCCIEPLNENEYLVTFSGARRPLFYFSKGELVEIVGDKKSIGQAKNDTSFQQSEFILHKGDNIYMKTDGTKDIISPDRVRFGSSRFREIVKKSSYLPLEAQKALIVTQITDFQGDAEQRDDILIVGVKL